MLAALAKRHSCSCFWSIPGSSTGARRIRADLKTRVVPGALDMALVARKPESVVHDSDRGSQHTALALGNRCKDAGVRPSTGSVGDAYDNAMCESFFAMRECELLDRNRFRPHSEARMAVFSFVEGFRNPSRRHSALGHLSPLEYDRLHHQPNRSAIAVKIHGNGATPHLVLSSET